MQNGSLPASLAASGARSLRQGGPEAGWGWQGTKGHTPEGLQDGVHETRVAKVTEAGGGMRGCPSLWGKPRHDHRLARVRVGQVRVSWKLGTAILAPDPALHLTQHP